MRRILTLFGVLLCLCCVSTTAIAQNGQFDVRFAIKNFDCSNNTVTIQVQVKAHDAAHTFFMGDANYRFDYDPRIIHTPTLVSQETFSNQPPASDFNYNPQNLTGSSAGLTLGTVSLNTLYGNGGNAAKAVGIDWITVSNIRFTVQDPTKCFDLIWHDDTRFPITGMNEIEILGGGVYGQYIVPSGGVFTNYSACIPQVCGGITALNDINVTLKNTIVSGNLLTNDNSPYAMTATTTPFLNPIRGTLTIGANGSYTYTPVLGYVGTDVAKYIVCNTAGLCDTASLFLNVLDVPVANVNSAPLAQNDNGVTYVNIPLSGNVLANDIDPEKNTLTVNTTPLSMPTNGTLVLNADGSYVYTPVAGFVGTDSFRYTVCDNGSPSQCSTATVSIEVLNNTTGGSVNLPPTANDDSYLTYKNTNVSGNLKSNDADPNTGQTLTYNTTPITNPANGTVTINADGTFTYVPTTGYLGPDAFKYAVCDNGSPSKCDTATAFVIISTVPNQQPLVTVTPQNILEDVSTTFCLPIVDSNTSDTHTVTVCGVTGGGTATAVVNNVTRQVCVTYLSALNYNGAASVCLNVCDNGTPSKCDNVTVPITVTPVNDKPIIAVVTPLTTPEDIPLTYCATIADVDVGSAFTATSCGAANGTVVAAINGGQVCVTYTPTVDFNGLDSACVIVCDNGNPTLCDTLRVRITVTPVNDNPVIVDLTPQTTLEDTPLNVCTTINDIDGGSPVFTATLCGVTNGTATPSVVGNQLCLNYVPTSNFNGAATVCVIVCDNGSPSKCDTMNVAITVTPVNDTPVIVDLAPQTTAEDTPLNVCTTINDVDVSSSFTATLCGVTNGTATPSVVGNQLCINYIPTLNYNGAASVCVIICDNGSPSKCDTTTVAITVTPVNDNPVIVDLAPQTTLEDTPLNVCTTINDVDVSSAFTATLCGVTNGTATPSVVGNQLCLNYVPTSNYNGAATVCVIVCDNGSPSKCDTMNVAITVTPVNDTPVIVDLAPQTTAEDTPLNVCTTINDVDVSSSFTATLCGVTNGTATPSVVGNQLCINYIPTLNYNGAASVCVIVCDNGSPSKCDTTTVVLTVTPVNDNPVIVDLAPQTTLEDTPLNVCTTINDVDVSSTFTATLCGVTNGTATPSVVGNQLCLNYVPTSNYNGAATVCVIVCDNGSPSKCDTMNVAITVTPVNDKPVITVVPITVNEDGTTTVCMPITDPDVGNSFTSTSCGAQNGTVSTAIVAGQVCVTYTPKANYYGIDSACVIVCDNGSPSKCDTIKAPITVAPVNDAPVVPDGAATTLNSAPVTICVPIVDVDPTDTHTVSVCGAPTMGTISSVINNGTRQLCVTYTPNLVAVGMDVVCLNICDNGSPSKCDVTNLTFNIGSTNKPPVTMNDINSTLKNTAVSGNVLTNDSDPNSNTLTVSTTPVQAPSNGTVVLNANGTYTYTPNANFVGTDVFKYQVCDNGTPTMCTTATVTIEVREVLTSGANQAPIATDDNTATPSGVTIIVNVKANDFDPQGGTIYNPTLAGTATGGTPSVNPDGTIAFVPTLGFVGNASFKYVICDNGMPVLCDTATVNVTVYPNTAQGNVPPVANNDAFPIVKDTPFVGNVSTNDFDQNAGQTLTYTATTTPLHGNVTLLSNGQFSYVPTTGFVGIDSFKYQVCDNNTPTATCATATTYFNVAPTAATPTNVAPIINNDVTTTYTNTAINIAVKANDYDPNGSQVLTNPAIVGTPTSGTAVVNPDGTVTFTPSLGFTGTASFVYQVCDNGAPSICVNATATVNVLPLPAIANRPPTAINDAATTLANTSINGSALNNDSDPDAGQTLTYTRLTAPTNGISSLTSAGAYSYTPLSNFVGLDSFQYKICDNGNPTMCDTAWIVVNITSPIGATNVAPTVGNDNTATSINTAVVINVKANDYDLNVGQMLGLPTIIGTSIGGVPSVNPDGTITFTPTTGFTGVASFNYQVCDNGSPSLCKTAMVTVDVVGIVNYVNVAPTAANDATTTPMNTAVAGNAKTNDFDFNNGQSLSYSLTTPAINGTMVMQASGTYVYTPNTGFVGLDSARYTVCDNASPTLCSTAWVYIQTTATGVNTNTSPVVLSDVASTTQSIPVNINVKGNDYDPNTGQSLGLPTITGIVPNGTATVNSDGTITFTPTAGFIGTSTFSYTICDNGSASLCVTASVTVTVLATPPSTNANMPPTAMDDSYQVLKGTSITGSLGLNDTDPNVGQSLTHSLLTNPTRGVMSLNANGTYSYTPNAGFTGTDQFLYKVCDNGNPSLCDTATVYITIYEFPCVTLTLKALLEGPLNSGTGLMGTVLNQRGLLPGQTPIGQFAVATPVGHPYRGAPWNLVDTTGQNLRTYPSNAVDWVLVSLRASNSSSANILRIPALLLNDGTVSFINPCFSLPTGNYFVVIEHRNHMGVMSPTAVPVVNGVLVFDFTTGNSLTSISVNDPPATGQKTIGTKWAMHAGDGKKTTQTTNFDINFNDSQLWKLESGIFDQYRYGDFNMNADVNFQDQVLWKNNNGRYSIIPH